MKLIRKRHAMKRFAPPKIKKFPAAKQRRMDELLDKNSEGTITPAEKVRLKQLVSEAEDLMVINAKLLARFSDQHQVPPSAAVPMTVWVTPDNAQR
jgi:hypothetical protein